MDNTKYNIFFSKKCQFCIELIQHIQKYIDGYDKYFKFISIDKNREMTIKLKIKQIPSIIVNNKMYVGNDCFKLINMLISDIEEKNKFNVVPYDSENSNMTEFGDIANYKNVILQPLGDIVANNKRIEEDLDEARKRYQTVENFIPSKQGGIQNEQALMKKMGFGIDTSKKNVSAPTGYNPTMF